MTAAVRRRASTMRQLARRVHLSVGEGADRRQWRMQGSGRRENNEQTRGHLCRRSMRRLFFRLAEAASQSAGLLVLLVTKVRTVAFTGKSDVCGRTQFAPTAKTLVCTKNIGTAWTPSPTIKTSVCSNREILRWHSG